MFPFGGLRRTLVSAIVTTIGTLILALMLLEDPLVEYQLGRLAQEDLALALDEISADLNAGGDPDEIADRVGAERGCRVTILAGRTIVGDSGFDGANLARAQAAVHEDALGQFLSGRTFPRTARGDHRAFRRAERHVVQVLRSTATADRMRTTIRELLIIGGVMASLIALLLTIVLGRALVQPAQELTEVANTLAEGDLSARTNSERDDELGTIGRALDHMADTLAERITRLRAEQDRLRTILNSMVEAVFVTDSLGRIVQTNQALDFLVDGDARGRTSLEAIPSKKLRDAIRSARKKRHAIEVEFKIRVGGGSKRAFRAQVAPLQEGAGVIAVLHDVSRLKEIDRIRRDFVANASHELRTPLTAIRGFSETLRDGALEDPDAARRFLEVIIRHTLRLQALVDDLAALSKAESPEQELQLEPVDVEVVIGEVIRGLTAKATEHNIQVLFQPSSLKAVAMANARGLDQVLINLIENAIKYSPEGSSVRVRVLSSESVISIEVNNPGPPIKPKHQKRLFERFYRVDKGRSRDRGGTGLGLAIVKHLCTAMNGVVAVESNEADGTTFRVSLPQVEEEDTQESAEGGAEAPLPPA
ncbi:MAG: ATP-binding protein [Myxococcota bacterium]